MPNTDPVGGRKKAPRARRSVSVRIQYGGLEWSAEVLTERAIVAWAAEQGLPRTEAREIKLYVKPEEHMVYYVINEIPGAFRL